MWDWIERLHGWRQRPRYTTSPGAPNQPGRIPVIELRDGDSLWQGHADYLRRLGDRYYEFHDGRKDRTKPAPVVMLLHGRGGNAASARWNFQFEKEADKRGFVVLYPAGQPLGVWADRNLGWNDGVGMSDPPKDDVLFLASVLVDLRTYIAVSKRCVGGHSNGSAMAFRYAMEANVECVAGNAGVIAPASSSPKIPVFYSHSIYDDLVNFELCMEIAEKWIEHNGLNPGIVYHDVVAKCDCDQWDGEFPVHLWSISPGGHSVPGGKVGPHEPKSAEPVNTDISWSEKAGEFFAEVLKR